jgi:hypothetical protein
MVGRILGAHPSLFTFHELHFFEELWSPGSAFQPLPAGEAEDLVRRLFIIQRHGYLTQRKGKRDAACSDGETQAVVAHAGDQSGPSLFEAFLLHETGAHGRSIPVDQTPRNGLYLPEILRLYPEARIINMVRDPRDVLLSQKNKWKRRHLGGTSITRRESVRSWLNYHPLTIIKLWRASERAGRIAGSDPRVRTVRFEDLLSDPRRVVSSIVSHIGVDFDDRMLDIPVVGSSVGHDDPHRMGIDAGRTGGWRAGLSATEIAICERCAGSEAIALGYLPSGVRPSRFALVAAYLRWPAQVLVALAFNLHRMKNIANAIRRRLG